MQLAFPRACTIADVAAADFLPILKIDLGAAVMARNYSYAGTADGWRERLDRLDRLSRLLDVAFTVPGTNVRFGAEAIMRLVPGIGDAAASALSCLILYEAHRLGVPRRLMIRMAGNVAIEAAAGAVPVIGDLFDVVFRANRRNVELLREHFGFETAGEAREV
jgi:hypothetical protein